MAEPQRAQNQDETPVGGAKFLIVEARYYDSIGAMLLDGATAALTKAGATFDIVNVPGALEIAVALKAMAESGEYDALIALGCIIRGETYHFELVANESGAGVTRVSLDHQLPIANAILTVQDEAQAWARAEEKGREAARVAVEMANLLEDLS